MTEQEYRGLEGYLYSTLLKTIQQKSAPHDYCVGRNEHINNYTTRLINPLTGKNILSDNSVID